MGLRMYAPPDQFEPPFVAPRDSVPIGPSVLLVTGGVVSEVHLGELLPLSGACKNCSVYGKRADET